MAQFIIEKSITDRTDPQLRRYLEEIRNFPMISPEEEVELAERIKNGDKEALKKLVNANLRFVISVAKQYQQKGTSLIDLINEGNYGLIIAAQRFDASRGFKFISYAVWWIRQSIMKSLTENTRMIRVPSNKVALLSQMTKEFLRLEQEFNRPPTAEELAKRMGIPSYKVKELMEAPQYTSSLDKPVGDNEDGRLIDLIASEIPNTDGALIQDSLNRDIERALRKLNEKERTILQLFFGIGQKQAWTLEEIGEKYNMTRERARQLKEKALRMLKQPSTKRILQTYLA
jgi:RNA polymerase primary sigma factor